ncbi:hypothetical protein [Fusobacterium pseudoperiodonticum]|uniref:hypothetical protein n=1 Tax=Fusobacterium pseudoperiodonticum TaxID=2663009 RepID=UPI000C1B508F|nr:hypothetical protein [Fusobacterium pseudoperiodonticum]ATV56709.1 hypothetical protein CTM68_02655 [Fusobacterium pseudoperiodonticum]ATV68737.1 hypothetical protein CTM92_09210 [Fusobacterium pseudoperiodonticum]PIM78337.1 hypothetical protein CTM69_02320 [Fusobacterium pseudoperiodonticum]
MRTFIGIVVTFFIFFILIFIIRFVYVVPENHYSILDQTGEVRLEDYPELKEVSFMYSTDLLIEFYKKIDNLELEKINFRINDEVIGTVEINKDINDLENFGQTYTANNGKKVVIRKSYPLQKEFLRILGKRNEKYKVGTGTIEGRFYIDIYIKDLKTNKTFIIKRDNISIYYESGGPKIFIPSV